MTIHAEETIEAELEARNPAARADSLDPATFGQTPSQTVGPFFHYGLPWKGGADLVGNSQPGARPELMPDNHYMLKAPAPARPAPSGDVIEVAGRVLDANGDPVPDAMIELWQANAAGRYACPDDAREDVPLDPNFSGWGRSSTDEDGTWRFITIRPGQVPGPGNTLQAPHLMLSVFGRGLLKRLATRLYFADGKSNDVDPILAMVPEERRETLIATRKDDGSWWFDIHLQGDNETVFFDL